MKLKIYLVQCVAIILSLFIVGCGQNFQASKNSLQSVDPLSLENGACGSANGVAVISAPIANLCSSGTATAVTGSGPFTWFCNGQNGGTNASCSAALRTFTITPLAVVNVSINPGSVQTVNAGATKSFTVTADSGYTRSSTVGGTCPAGSWSGAVYTTGPITANCTIQFTGTAGPVNGACGSANGVAVSSAPSTNLCNSGTASTVSGSGPFTWSCAGVSGGTNASCSAPLSSASTFTITPLAVVNVSINPGSVQTVNAGATKSFTVTPDSGYTRSSTVGGTCPAGSWSGAVYTTGAITANCTIQFSGTASSANTLEVGPGKTYSTVSAAVTAAQNGYTIEVSAGTYTNDFPANLNKNLTIKGVGGKPIIRATQTVPNRKGIFLINATVTLQNLEITGGKVSETDGANGSGIRFESGNLIVDDCYVHDNQNGMLGVGTGEVTVKNSRFVNNGVNDPASTAGYGYTHGIYMNSDKLTITNSYFFSNHAGHHIKSRSTISIIKNNVVVDGSNGNASYNINFPNGGQVTVQNNLIQKGPNASNSPMITYGEEGMTKATNSILISGNTALNDKGTVIFFKNSSTINPTITNNKVFGISSSQMVNGPGSASGTVILSVEPYTAPSWTLNVPTPWPSEATGG